MSCQRRTDPTALLHVKEALVAQSILARYAFDWWPPGSGRLIGQVTRYPQSLTAAVAATIAAIPARTAATPTTSTRNLLYVEGPVAMAVDHGPSPY